MQIESTTYVNGAREIEIERVPNEGLMRIRVRGNMGHGDVLLRVWGVYDETTGKTALPELKHVEPEPVDDSVDV